MLERSEKVETYLYTKWVMYNLFTVTIPSFKRKMHNVYK